MHFSYDKIWKLLIDQKINKQKLKEMSKVSSASMAKLGKGQNVTTDVLLCICMALNCQIGDIMEIVPDDNVQTERSTWRQGSKEDKVNGYIQVLLLRLKIPI